MNTYVSRVTVPQYANRVDGIPSIQEHLTDVESTINKWRSDISWEDIPAGDSSYKIEYDAATDKVVVTGKGKRDLDAHVIAKIVEFRLKSGWINDGEADYFRKVRADEIPKGQSPLMEQSMAIMSEVSLFKYEIHTMTQGKGVGAPSLAEAEGIEQEIQRQALEMTREMQRTLSENEAEQSSAPDASPGRSFQR